MPKAARLLAAAAALLLTLPAAAQYLYKWTDADGRMQYSDRPPKNPSGAVTRIDIDAQPPAPVAPPAAPRAAPKVAAPDKGDVPTKDMGTQRRETREALALRMAQAREKLENARKALADGQNPEVDERQVVRQVQDGQGGMHGLTQARSNCSQIIRDGKVIGVMCPSIVANEAYFERIAKLEAAVKSAEEDVNVAEQAYRRGVD